MKSTKLLAITMATGLVFAGLLPQAQAKKWTITQRQEKLSREIEQGQKAGELTLDEANNMKEKESDIENRIAKMKDKNGGKLSYADENKIESDLNKLSLTIQKKKLQKRVAHP